MNEKLLPMLATGGKLDGKWENPQWIAEEKIDGSRYLMKVGSGLNQFTSRQISRKNGLPVDKTENVPHLSKHDFGDWNGTILDGEMRHKDFNQTVSIMGSKPS